MHASIDGFAMPPEESVRQAADVLRMLSDPTRLKIVWALLQGETSVACLADLIGATPTAVSQHLSKLRLAGIVSNRRDRNFIFYTVENDTVRRVLRDVLVPAGTPTAALPPLR